MSGPIPQQVDNTQKSKLAYSLDPAGITLGAWDEKLMMQAALSSHNIYVKYYYNEPVNRICPGEEAHTEYLQFFLGALPLFYEHYETPLFRRFARYIGNAVHFEHKDLGGISNEEALFLPADKKQHMRHVYGMGAFIHRFVAKYEQLSVGYSNQEEEFLGFYYQLRHGKELDFKDNLALKYRVVIEIGEDLLKNCNFLRTSNKFILNAVEQGLQCFRAKLNDLIGVEPEEKRDSGYEIYDGSEKDFSGLGVDEVLELATPKAGVVDNREDVFGLGVDDSKGPKLDSPNSSRADGKKEFVTMRPLPTQQPAQELIHRRQRGVEPKIQLSRQIDLPRGSEQNKEGFLSVVKDEAVRLLRSFVPWRNTAGHSTPNDKEPLLRKSSNGSDRSDGYLHAHDTAIVGTSTPSLARFGGDDQVSFVSPAGNPYKNPGLVRSGSMPYLDSVSSADSERGGSGGEEEKCKKNANSTSPANDFCECPKCR
ncbi:MAG: hypothetical protein KAS93_03000 [Gammaproteobacteria bacterium]|nr:hypothetical protein [Gammaproteobacteria bacterium]